MTARVAAEEKYSAVGNSKERGGTLAELRNFDLFKEVPVHENSTTSLGIWFTRLLPCTLIIYLVFLIVQYTQRPTVSSSKILIMRPDPLIKPLRMPFTCRESVECIVFLFDLTRKNLMPSITNPATAEMIQASLNTINIPPCMDEDRRFIRVPAGQTVQLPLCSTYTIMKGLVGPVNLPSGAFLSPSGNCVVSESVTIANYNLTRLTQRLAQLSFEVQQRFSVTVSGLAINAVPTELPSGSTLTNYFYQRNEIMTLAKRAYDGDVSTSAESFSDDIFDVLIKFSESYNGYLYRRSDIKSPSIYYSSLYIIGTTVCGWSHEYMIRALASETLFAFNDQDMPLLKITVNPLLSYTEETRPGSWINIFGEIGGGASLLMAIFGGMVTVWRKFTNGEEKSPV